MAELAQLSSKFKINSRHSFGPFCGVDEELIAFDTKCRPVVDFVGKRSNAALGATTWQECWGGPRSKDFEFLETSLERLFERSAGTSIVQMDEVQTWLAGGKRSSEQPDQLIGLYNRLSLLEQFSESRESLGQRLESLLLEKLTGFESFVQDAVYDPVNFRAFLKVTDEGFAQKFASSLLVAGILNNGLVEKSDRKGFEFQFNTAFRAEYLDGFVERFGHALELASGKRTTIPSMSFAAKNDAVMTADYYGEFLSAKKQASVENGSSSRFLNRFLEKFDGQLKSEVVTAANYLEHRDKILAIQELIYEPARRTPAEEFDMLFDSDCPLAIVILKDDEIAGMAFAGRLNLFLMERGVKEDPFVDDPSVFYSMDLTVLPKFRGGMGTALKRAIVLLALENGVTAIHGRNRDRLAAGMWAINLSLGAYELMRLKDDYPDQERFRDCIYYRCPLTWQAADLTFSATKTLSDLSVDDLL